MQPTPRPIRPTARPVRPTRVGVPLERHRHRARTA